ncbi:MAG: hypothetical protein RJA98_3563 [Pseudomonadota bacterium]
MGGCGGELWRAGQKALRWREYGSRPGTLKLANRMGLCEQRWMLPSLTLTPGESCCGRSIIARSKCCRNAI